MKAAKQRVEAGGHPNADLVSAVLLDGSTRPGFVFMLVLHSCKCVWPSRVGAKERFNRKHSQVDLKGGLRWGGVLPRLQKATPPHTW